MTKIPTLYSDYKECMLDLDIYGKIVATPQQSLEDLEKTLFEEFQRRKPMPTLEYKRYELSRLVNPDYRIAYNKELELQDNERLLDLQSDLEASYENIDFEDLSSLIPTAKELFSYENHITDSMRSDIVAKYDLETGELFEPGIMQTENIVGSVEEDENTVLTEEKIANLGVDEEEEEVSMPDDPMEVIAYNDREKSETTYEVDDEVTYEIDDDSVEEDSDDYDSYDEESEDEDDYDSYDEDSDENEEDEPESEVLDEDNSEDDDYNDLEDEDDYDSYDLEDEESSDEDDLGSEDEVDYADSEDEDDYDNYDEDSEDDYDSYDSDDDSEETKSEDTEDSEDSDYDDYDEDSEDDETSEDSDVEDDFESYDLDDDTSEQEVDASKLRGSPSKSDIDFDDISDSFMDSVLDEPKVTTSEHIINKSVETPVTPAQIHNNVPASEIIDRSAEPTDIRAFLRKHPRCDYDFALKYFTKKQINDAIKIGKIIKKGNILKI